MKGKGDHQRREERNKTTLFLKGIGQSMKASDLKALHPNIVDVRVVSSNAWLTFPNEAACVKAHKVLSAKKVKGKPLIVDFCGSKSQNNANKKENSQNGASKKNVKKIAAAPKVEEMEEDSDVEDEGMDDEELEDEDLLDEMDDEELGDEQLGDEESDLDAEDDDEDDSEEDEETNEGPIKPILNQKGAKVTNGTSLASKSPQIKSILKTPTKENSAKSALKDTPSKGPAKKEVILNSKKQISKKEEEELDDDDSDLDDEDDEENDSEEYEESDESSVKPVVVNQKASKKAKAATPVAKSTPQQTKSILKKPDTPANAKGLTKNLKKENNVAERKGEKRKAPVDDDDSSPALHSTKQPRLNDQTSIMSEEERRREERNKKSLFVKGVGKSMKISDLKALHPDIVDVRVVSSHAWLIFPTEIACEKAQKALSTKKSNGKPLVVDFCGSKSLNKTKGNDSKKDRPLDPLRIVISGIKNTTTQEQLKVLFPNSTSIKIWNRPNNSKTMVFISFNNEAEARAAFKKGESLKIGGTPVDVFYARIIPDSKVKK